jgi:hypothetical protein
MIHPTPKIKPIIQKIEKANRISYVVFGDHPQYSLGMFHNLVIAPKIYPGWVPRIYTDKIDHRCNFYEEMNAEVFLVKDNLPAMLWRMLSIDDERCARIIFRDADSLLSFREKSAVDEWINSKKTFHRMKESPHLETTPVLAGMWGVNSDIWRSRFGRVYESLKNLDFSEYNQSLDNQNTPARFRPKIDEKFLFEHVWNIAQDDFYSSGLSDRYGESVGFAFEYESHNKFSVEPCDFVGSRIYNAKWFKKS